MAQNDGGFGLSFAPFASAQGYQNPNTPGDLTPVQEAVQILSLRRPTLTGAAPVSNALFNGPGLGGQPDFGALLQTLMAQFGTNPYHRPTMPRDPGTLPPAPGPSMPTPQGGPVNLPTPNVDYTSQGPRTPNSGQGQMQPPQPMPPRVFDNRDPMHRQA